jgi:hypothetical protein
MTGILVCAHSDAVITPLIESRLGGASPNDMSWIWISKSGDPRNVRACGDSELSFAVFLKDKEKLC